MESESSCVKVEILDSTYSAEYGSLSQRRLGIDEREIGDEISYTSSINNEILNILLSLKNIEREKKRILFEKIMEELQAMMKDRLKDWKEEEHEATKLLFSMFKGKSR
ncbi:MAG: hypothetical protein ACTSWV_01975 [Candidatus Asgardarchaeia archaeon]